MVFPKLDQIPTNVQIVGNNGFATNAFVMFLTKLVNKLNAGTSDLATQINAVTQRISSIVANYTVPVGNYSVLANATSGAIIVTLPLASTATTYIIGITKTDSSANIVTIQRSGSDLICGSTSQTLLYQNEVLNFISDGTNWQLAN